MVTVKQLKPYRLKVEKEYVHVLLAYQYFDVWMDEKLYKFVPLKAQKIKMNRYTKKIENMGDVFAFRCGNEMIEISMRKLVFIPEFLIQLHMIVHPYYIEKKEQKLLTDTHLVIEELEQGNIRRLIDLALDSRDEGKFYELSTILRDKTALHVQAD